MCDWRYDDDDEWRKKKNPVLGSRAECWCFHFISNNIETFLEIQAQMYTCIRVFKFIVHEFYT